MRHNQPESRLVVPGEDIMRVPTAFVTLPIISLVPELEHIQQRTRGIPSFEAARLRVGSAEVAHVRADRPGDLTKAGEQVASCLGGQRPITYCTHTQEQSTHPNCRYLPKVIITEDEKIEDNSHELHNVRIIHKHLLLASTK
jgi:hypothetical protein